MQRCLLLKAARELRQRIESAKRIDEPGAKDGRASCALESGRAEKIQSGRRSGGGEARGSRDRADDVDARTILSRRTAALFAVRSWRRLLGARREAEGITGHGCEGRKRRAVRFLSNPSRRSERECAPRRRRASTLAPRVLPRAWATWPCCWTRACNRRSLRSAGRREFALLFARAALPLVRLPIADAARPFSRPRPLDAVDASPRRERFYRGVNWSTGVGVSTGRPEVSSVGVFPC